MHAIHGTLPPPPSCFVHCFLPVPPSIPSSLPSWHHYQNRWLIFILFFKPYLLDSQTRNACINGSQWLIHWVMHAIHGTLPPPPSCFVHCFLPVPPSIPSSLPSWHHYQNRWLIFILFFKPYLLDSQTRNACINGSQWLIHWVMHAIHGTLPPPPSCFVHCFLPVPPSIPSSLPSWHHYQNRWLIFILFFKPYLLDSQTRNAYINGSQWLIHWVMHAIHGTLPPPPSCFVHCFLPVPPSIPSSLPSWHHYQNRWLIFILFFKPYLLDSQTRNACINGSQWLIHWVMHAIHGTLPPPPSCFVHCFLPVPPSIPSSLPSWHHYQNRWLIFILFFKPYLLDSQTRNACINGSQWLIHWVMHAIHGTLPPPPSCFVHCFLPVPPSIPSSLPSWHHYQNRWLIFILFFKPYLLDSQTRNAYINGSQWLIHWVMHAIHGTLPPPPSCFVHCFLPVPPSIPSSLPSWHHYQNRWLIFILFFKPYLLDSQTRNACINGSQWLIHWVMHAIHGTLPPPPSCFVHCFLPVPPSIPSSLPSWHHYQNRWLIFILFFKPYLLDSQTRNAYINGSQWLIHWVMHAIHGTLPPPPSCFVHCFLPVPPSIPSSLPSWHHYQNRWLIFILFFKPYLLDSQTRNACINGSQWLIHWVMHAIHGTLPPPPSCFVHCFLPVPPSIPSSLPSWHHYQNRWLIFILFFKPYLLDSQTRNAYINGSQWLIHWVMPFMATF